MVYVLLPFLVSGNMFSLEGLFALKSSQCSLLLIFVIFTYVIMLNDVQCLFFSLFYVQPRDQFCYSWSACFGKSAEVSPFSNVKLLD